MLSAITIDKEANTGRDDGLWLIHILPKKPINFAHAALKVYVDVDSKILIAAISVVSAIAGAVISQIVRIFLSHLERKHQKKILLREKYEKLILLVDESSLWISAQIEPENVAAICPNCHRRAHVSKDYAKYNEHLVARITKIELALQE